MELIVIVTLAAGLIVVSVWSVYLARGRQDTAAQLAELLDQASTQLVAAQAQALQQNSAQFLDLATTRLSSETAKTETQLRLRSEQIDKTVSQLRDYVRQVENTRVESTAGLLKTMESLGQTASKLAEVLASGPARGQWGERMAEDILRVAGLEEGIQYRRHSELEGGTGRPDFTFVLPQGRLLNMDVKFPLSAYVRFLEAESDSDKANAVRDFLRDARARVKEITNREYIDPAGGTLDYVLLFIPNEQIYGFLHERDPSLLDEALKQRVVLCSPFTLFAILVVMRQAMDNFYLSHQTNEILRVLGTFNQQWGRFKQAMERVESRLESGQKAFRELVGVRQRTLDRQVEKVELLRLEAGIESESLDGSVPDAGQLVLNEIDTVALEDPKGST
jgi:DNA recombination protein RmuC